MKRYVEVSREAMCKALEAAGFHRQEGSGEVTYARQHHVDPTMYVLVYTSIAEKAEDARGCGDDAIRVVLIFKNERSGKSGGLFKAPRVYRTGSEQAVIERTLQRAREAYHEANVRAAKRLGKTLVPKQPAQKTLDADWPTEQCGRAWAGSWNHSQ